MHQINSYNYVWHKSPSVERVQIQFRRGKRKKKKERFCCLAVKAAFGASQTQCQMWRSRLAERWPCAGAVRKWKPRPEPDLHCSQGKNKIYFPCSALLLAYVHEQEIHLQFSRLNKLNVPNNTKCFVSCTITSNYCFANRSSKEWTLKIKLFFTILISRIEDLTCYILHFLLSSASQGVSSFLCRQANPN